MRSVAPTMKSISTSCVEASASEPSIVYVGRECGVNLGRAGIKPEPETMLIRGAIENQTGTEELFLTSSINKASSGML